MRYSKNSLFKVVKSRFDVKQKSLRTIGTNDTRWIYYSGN